MSRKFLRRLGKFVLLLFVVVLIAATAAGWWGWQRYQHFADTPVPGLEAGTSVVIERGDSLPVVVRRLRDVGVYVGHPIEWRVLSRELGADGRLQVGEYALAPGMAPRDILVAMRDGKVVRYTFTVLPGRNMRELRAALARAEPLHHETGDLDDEALMDSLGHPGQHPEGRFLPETYHYTRGDSDLDILRRAHAAMQKALDEAWAARAPDTMLSSPDEMLVLASIVEKETGIAEERPLIAGVFERRLKIGMKLQTDPTVIYGLGTAYDGNIRRRDLAADTPYNTYTRGGLPPTPIAMPGVEALQAVAQPAEGDALYFVAVGDGSGRHVFSRTLAEHNAAVAQYLRRYRQARAAERAAGLDREQDAPAVGTGPETP